MILSAFDAQLEWHLRHLEESHYSKAWWREKKTHNQEGIRFHGRGVEGVDLHLCVSKQAQVSWAEHGGKHHCCLPTILGPVFPKGAEHFPDHSADDSSLHATPISVVQLWWPLLLVASQHWSPNLSLHPGFFVRSSRKLWSNWYQKKIPSWLWLPAQVFNLAAHNSRVYHLLPHQTPHLYPHACVFLVLKAHWSPEISLWLSVSW